VAALPDAATAGNQPTIMPPDSADILSGLLVQMTKPPSKDGGHDMAAIFEQMSIHSEHADPQKADALLQVGPKMRPSAICNIVKRQ
jgi:hypothetical protein